MKMKKDYSVFMLLLFISHIFSACEAENAAVMEFSPGTYTYSAVCYSAESVSGQFQVTEGGCQQIQIVF